MKIIYNKFVYFQYLKGVHLMEHRELAVKCFNKTWDLIDKENKTDDEILNMIHMAHTSRYHWGEIGTPLEFSRGEWQISRVYALAGLGESALYHGKHALRYCLENGIGDFDLAFAYESIARAYSVLHDELKKQSALEKAMSASMEIKKMEDKDYFLSELSTIK